MRRILDCSYPSTIFKLFGKRIENERQKKILNKLLDGFDGKLTSSKWAKIGKCSQDTALRDIKDLIDKQILYKLPMGGRSTGYALMEKSYKSTEKLM